MEFYEQGTGQFCYCYRPSSWHADGSTFLCVFKERVGGGVGEKQRKDKGAHTFWSYFFLIRSIPSLSALCPYHGPRSYSMTLFTLKLFNKHSLSKSSHSQASVYDVIWCRFVCVCVWGEGG